MRYDPRPYQFRLRRFILEHPYANILVDMGLGKTVEMLTSIIEMLEAGEIRAALIVAPVRVCEATWPEEIAKWDHTKHLTYSLIRGDIFTRTLAKQGGKQIYLANYELFEELARSLDPMPELPFDMIVFDESTKMKSPKSARFKNTRRFLGRFKRRVCMTGTPVPNNLHDFWAQSYCSDRGYRLGTRYAPFEERYFIRNPYSQSIKIRDESAANEIISRVCDNTFVLRSQDHLSLPPQTDNDIFVELPQSLRASYDKFHAEMFATIDRAGLTGATADVRLEAFSRAVVSGRCRQLTSGAIYTNPERTAWTEIHKAKIEVVDDIIESSGGSPVLLMSEFRHEIERWKKCWPRLRVVTDEKDIAWVKAWNAGEIPILVGHPLSLGHGLNLQYGPGHTLVWPSPTWSREAYDQTVKRLHRSGQRAPVVSHRIVMRNTVDEMVIAALKRKGDTQTDFLRALL